MKQTRIEKIVQQYAVDLEKGALVQSGDTLAIRPKHIMTHDNTSAIIPKFKGTHCTQVAYPRQPVFVLDHNIQDKSESNLAKYKKIESFASKMGIDFYPAGSGISHQVMCEEGYVLPGSMVVGSDSHSNMYGGLGALGTPVVRTDAAALWATGQTWWQVPPVVRVVLSGALQPGTTGKDVIISLCGLFGDGDVLNHALEFTGDGVPHLSIDQRLTIANMTTEWGALAAVFDVDEATFEWLENRISTFKNRPSPLPSVHSAPLDRLNHSQLNALRQSPIIADKGAYYAKEIHLDLSSISPHVAGPDHVNTIMSISEAESNRISIDKAYLVSCVNSRFEDLAQAAQVLKGYQVADRVSFYIAAASKEVQTKSEDAGHWKQLLDAGAIPLPPGCGPCIGLGVGLLEDGEVGISATNRNFKGRMGSRNAKAYLASPSVVAASAMRGYISGPSPTNSIPLKGDIISIPKPSKIKTDHSLLPDFSQTLSGELIFCPQDNMNTDGIYPGKYTYMDSITPQKQAEVVMENYDPNFTTIAKSGDILVGGYNFGTGSSREQAATALKYKGIQCVIAGSFSETYKRNAINNGFLVLEIPELTDYLLHNLNSKSLTISTKISATINFKHSQLSLNGKDYPFTPIGLATQELIIAGSLENWVKIKKGG